MPCTATPPAATTPPTGTQALDSETTGGNNTVYGYEAGSNATGSGNVFLGFKAGINATGDNNIEIGTFGATGDTATTRIGNGGGSITQTFIDGIYGVSESDGVAVYINSDGQLGTLASSARFKENIRDMSTDSAAIYALRPVSFQYKHAVGPQGVPESGLIAEEVEKVDPALVVHDKDGKPYSVRYEQVNAMLLNEFLKEHRCVAEQSATLAGQATVLADQAAAIAELRAKVARLEAPSTPPAEVR